MKLIFVLVLFHLSFIVLAQESEQSNTVDPFRINDQTGKKEIRINFMGTEIWMETPSISIDLEPVSLNHPTVNRAKVCESKGGFPSSGSSILCDCLEFGHEYGSLISEIDSESDITCPYPHHRKLPPSMHVLERVTKNCIEDRYWENAGCTFEQITDDEGEYYMNPLLEFFVKSFLRIEYGVFEIVDNFLDIPLRRLAGKLTDNDVMASGFTSKQEVVKALQEVMAKKRYTDCQKACLVKCFSSTILEKKYNFSSKFGAVSNSYLTGEGECTEYARVADQLASKIGLASRYDMGNSHMFNRVKIDGEWYISEPRNRSCTFFRPYVSKIKVDNTIRNKSNKKSFEDNGRSSVKERRVLRD